METIKRILEEFNACTNLAVRAFDRFENCLMICAGPTNRLCCYPLWRKTVCKACELLHSGIDQEHITLQCEMAACPMMGASKAELSFTACYIDPAMPELGTFVFGPYMQNGGDPVFPLKPARVVPHLISLLRMISQKHLKQDMEFLAKQGNSYQISRCIGFIKNQLWGNVTLQEASDYLDLNPSYLCRLFKKEMGCSFSQYINRLRVERSQVLLCDQTYSMLEITLAVGFSSQSYFNRVFKSICGKTPQEYRESVCTIYDNSQTTLII